MLLLDVVRSLSDEGVRFAVAGGYAVALHGAVRGTVDLDLVLAAEESNYVAAERALEALGLSPRLPVTAREVFQFRQEYIAKRNLVAWSFCDPADPTRLVDIVITFGRRRIPTTFVTYQAVRIPVLSKAELIRMKEATGRPQDAEDVRALRRLP